MSWFLLACDRCGAELVRRGDLVATAGCPVCGARHVDVCELPRPAPVPSPFTVADIASLMTRAYLRAVTARAPVPLIQR